METTTMTGAAMTAARVTCDAWYGSNTAHSGDIGSVQGRSVSVAGKPAQDRLVGIDIVVDAAGFVAPSQGSVRPRLEGPPV